MKKFKISYFVKTRIYKEDDIFAEDYDYAIGKADRHIEGSLKNGEFVDSKITQDGYDLYAFNLREVENNG